MMPRPVRDEHDPNVRLERLDKRLRKVERRSQLPRSIAFGTLAMRCTGVQTGVGNTLAGHFNSFDWTQTAGDTLLDLSTNQPEVLVSGLYFLTFQPETIATLASGAQWQPHYVAKSTPHGSPFGTYDATTNDFENRVFANGTTAGMRQSIHIGPWAMNNNADNGGGGGDLFRLDVFYDGGADLTGSSKATAKLFVVLI